MKRVQWRTRAGVTQPCEDVMQPSQFTPFVVVCMTACCAAREVIPGNGAMGDVSGLLQHLAIADRG